MLRATAASYEDVSANSGWSTDNGIGPPSEVRARRARMNYTSGLDQVDKLHEGRGQDYVLAHLHASEILAADNVRLYPIRIQIANSNHLTVTRSPFIAVSIVLLLLAVLAVLIVVVVTTDSLVFIVPIALTALYIASMLSYLIVNKARANR